MFSDLVFAVSPWKICSSVQSTHFNRYSFPMSLWYNGEIFSATIWAMAEKITVKNVLRFNFHSKPLKNIAHSPPFKRYSSSMSLWYKAYYKTNIASLMRMNGQKLVEVARRWKRERSGFKTRTRHCKLNLLCHPETFVGKYENEWNYYWQILFFYLLTNFNFQWASDIKQILKPIP